MTHLTPEAPYTFRDRLLTVHRRDLRDHTALPHTDQLLLPDSLTVRIDRGASVVIKTAARDFCDYLEASMGIAAGVAVSGFDTAAKGDITVRLAADCGADLGDMAAYKGFVCTVGDTVDIVAHDDRGAAQALFYLEDMMTMASAPILDHGTFRSRAMVSPQMVHSGYGFDEFPEDYLARVAHEGRDAILVYTMDANITPSGYLSFNALIDSAAKWGIDVYAYSYIRSSVSPDAPGAAEFYEGTYGKLFKMCPGLRGVTLVGEAIEFPSRDPHVAKGRYFNIENNGILHGKPSSGSYPCQDYPDWIALVRDAVRKYRPDADVVLWSYNWGSQPEEARVRLIENLPTDIAFMATFEMFEPRKFGSAISHCADYTLSFEGPGAYFRSEAVAAKKRGIRLYSMTNTGGLTWDFGVIPYQPMPYQWMRRFEAMRAAHDDWGLCGIMECHHFGFYPSFVSTLAKWAFTEPRVDMEEVLLKLLRAEFGTENLPQVKKAMELFSEAIRHYTPSDNDQYGAFRIGPSYPFCLYRKTMTPSSDEAKARDPMFGSSICVYERGLGPDARDSVPAIRVPEELKSLRVMYSLMEEGVNALLGAPVRNETLDRLTNMAAFMLHCIVTGMHAKEFVLMKNKLAVLTDKGEIYELLEHMTTLLKLEIKNAEETIPHVEADSRLGWEPRMMYVTDRWHLEWKCRQVQAVIDHEIGAYKKSLML